MILLKLVKIHHFFVAATLDYQLLLSYSMDFCQNTVPQLLSLIMWIQFQAVPKQIELSLI